MRGSSKRLAEFELGDERNRVNDELEVARMKLKRQASSTSECVILSV